MLFPVYTFTEENWSQFKERQANIHQGMFISSSDTPTKYTFLP